MGAIASTALFLSASLPAAAPPDADRVAEATPAPIVIDLPPRFGRPRSLDEAIADEVRRDAAAYPGVAVAADDDAGDDGSAGEGDLDEAVVAAHDARIAFLRQRIEAVRPDEAGAAERLRAMRLRLQRAEAARRVALARSAPGAHRADDRIAAAQDAQVPGPAPIAAAVGRPAAARRGPAASPHPRPAGTAALPRPLHHRAGSQGKAGPAHPPAPGLLTASSGHARATQRAQGAGVQAGAGRSDASAQARRLLAAARRSVDALPEQRPTPVRLAGLWQWNGSETWSLADCPRRTA